MVEPLFWLGLSILLVAVSLTAVLVAALPVLKELARAARSAEKLFDTLRRDLPPTLEAIRLTGLEISDLTDDISDGVKSAGQVVKQVDRSLNGAKKQAKNVEVSTRSVFTGVKTAWRSFTRPSTSTQRSLERLPASQMQAVELQDNVIEEDAEVLASLEENSLPPTEPYYQAAPKKRKNPAFEQTDLEDFKPTNSQDF